jgi:hypothetical protein
LVYELLKGWLELMSDDQPILYSGLDIQSQQVVCKPFHSVLGEPLCVIRIHEGLFRKIFF